MNAQHKPEDYRHIRAWGRMLHSFEPYIREEQRMAAADGAPLDAVYQKTGYDESGDPLPRRWTCYSTVTNPETRLLMDELLKGVRA